MISPKFPQPTIPKSNIIYICACICLFIPVTSFLFSHTLTLKAATESKGKTLFSGAFDSSWIDSEAHLKYDLKEEKLPPELKAYNLQLTPISPVTLSLGSLQTSGLPSKVRNPLFSVMRTKAPQTSLTPKTLISPSSTKPPESIGIEIQSDGWKMSAEGIITDGHVSRFWMSSEQEYPFFGTSKSLFRVGIFCGYSENQTTASKSWFLLEKEERDGTMFHTAVDFSAKLHKTTVSSTLFLHIPVSGFPSPALRAQITFPIPLGFISAGIFSTEIDTSLFYAQKAKLPQSSYKNFEGKTQASSIRRYIGSENVFPLHFFTFSQLLLTTCLCYDTKKPTVWYESGKPHLTAGTSLSFTTFSTSAKIEYSNTAEPEFTGKDPLLVGTLSQSLPTYCPGNISATWKQTLDTKLLDIHIAFKPLSFLQLKSKTSFDFSQEQFVPPEESISLKGTVKFTHTDLEASLSAVIKTHKDVPNIKLSIKAVFSPS